MENNIKTFMEECKSIRSKGSKYVYKSNIKNYFKAINKSPEGYITVDIRKLSNGKKIDLLDKYEKDVRTFVESIKSKPPKTQQNMISIVKKFLSHFYIDLPQRFWDETVVKSVPITEKKTPENKDIRFILERGDIKHKALFSLVATSGMRIGEALSLTMDDIDINNRVIRVRDYNAKGKYARTTFFTEEVKELLLRWLELRDEYIKKKKRKSVYVRKQLEKNEGFVNMNLFPFQYDVARTMWIGLLEKAREPYNEKDNDARIKYSRYKYNEHSLRRFFKTKLRISGISETFINYMIGHETDLNTIYTDDNLFVRKVKEQYDKYSGALAIFSDAEQIKHELRPKIHNQDKLINSQRNEIDALQLRVKELENLKEFKKKYKIASNGMAQEHENYENAMDRIKDLEETVKTLVKMKDKE